MSCKAPGLPVSESHSELNQSSEQSDTECPSSEDLSSELDLQKEFDRLEKMKQRVLHLRGLLVRPSKTEFDYSDIRQISENIDKTGSGNPELKEVQLETAKAQLRINEIMRQLKEDRKRIGDLHLRIQEHIRCLRKLEKKMARVLMWQDELKHKAGLCIDRYNDLSISLSNYLDFSSYMRASHMKHLFLSKVRMKCYRGDYKAMGEFVTRTRTLLNTCYEKLMYYTHEVNQILDQPNRQFVEPSVSELSVLL
ncbi:hypothetical protein KR009_012052, partial [Drosophila setifemur]